MPHQISISVIEVRTPEVDFNAFQLPEGIIPLHAMHHMDHKMPRMLKVPILNANITISSLAKKSPIATLVPAGRCEQTQEIKWSVVQDAKQTAILEVTKEPKTIDLLKEPQLVP